MSGALAVTLVAIPVLGEHAGVYPYFLVSLGLLTIGGLFHEAHHASLMLWVALAMATLALLGDVYGRSRHALRVLLLRLLQVGGDTHQLFKQAERSLNELSAAVDRAARQRELLHSLGDALLTTSATGNIDDHLGIL